MPGDILIRNTGGHENAYYLWHWQWLPWLWLALNSDILLNRIRLPELPILSQTSFGWRYKNMVYLCPIFEWLFSIQIDMLYTMSEIQMKVNSVLISLKSNEFH